MAAGRFGVRRFFLTMCVPATIFVTPSTAQCEDAPKETKPARTRGELFVGLGVAPGFSNWSGDVLSYGALGVGLRLYEIITPFAEARVGYGRVDQRLLTYLSLGVAGTFRVSSKVTPRVLIGAVHQHEESIAAVAEAPAGALLGIGGGIRHRAGVQLGVGCDFKVFEKERFSISVGPEIRGAYLTYSSGPAFYGQIGAIASGYYRLF